MSRLPDWLHPWRWYAATVIIEALYRHLILRESARAIGIRFGRSHESSGWRSLRRWRKQLLISPLAVAVRGSLRGLVHTRRQAWPTTQFRPGVASTPDSGSKPTALPTEEGPVRGPPQQ
jgi:hypothetical protein